MTTSTDSPIRALADDLWDFQMRTQPVWSTFYRDGRYDDRLAERGPDARAAERTALEGLRTRLHAVPADGLDEEDGISHAVLGRMLDDMIESYDHHGWEWDFDQLGGLHVHLQDMLEFHPCDTEQGVRDLTARFAAVPRAVEQTLADLRDGIASGRTLPNVAYDRCLSQLRAFASLAPDDTPFVQCARNLPPDLPNRDALAADLEAAAREHVLPGYAALLAFFADEYAGRARTTAGVGSTPGGIAAYAHAARSQTTTDMTPEEIHALGLRELETNREEMLAIARANGHEGDLKSYLEGLSNDPAYRLKTREELLDRYRTILDRMDKELPRAFGLLPQAPYEVRPMPAFKEADAPAAYYYPPADDGSRPGIFFANTHGPENWPTYEMETLSYHEAVPGHHLQIAIAGERTELPKLRRHAHLTAYIEGWAHYAERLCDEMGMFTADVDRVGMLAGQAWRAARCVVDTGMHHFGWTREQAVELLRSIKTGPEADVLNEVDRYIVWPGQALAYKVGHRRIADLRAKAEAALGDGFDLRGFHDEVLRHGPLPLNVLDEVVDRWIASRAG